MADLLALSSRIVDAGAADEPTNRVTQQLSEVADDIAVVESFSHVVVLRTAAGLVCFDTSREQTGAACLEAVRGWSDEPIEALVYTHGHVDHVGGSGAFVAEARGRGRRAPAVVAHEALPGRFDRYRRTNGLNLAVNARQFGGIDARHGMGVSGDRRFLPDDVAEPTMTFADRTSVRYGDTLVELRHARGETDDHLWAWLPEHRALCVGDFVTWVFPNAGNPQKVQRYPGEWAAALREMAALDAELLLPAHGLPIGGRDRIRMVLDDLATALEIVVAGTLELMNEGATLDDVLASVRVPDELLAKPWCKPVYDEPEFVVHNVWRQYGGWWDGAPARLKPARDAAVAAEVVALTGGTAPLVARARELAEAGDLRLACHLVDLATGAEPDDKDAHAARSEIYAARRRAERSLMAKGVFAAAARQSAAVAGIETDARGEGLAIG
jgi:alkyl sulfatase BDS1-like metallo-beta-lactamase superfamily hydrolase